MTWLSWALLSALFAAATAILAKAGLAGINSHVATAVRTSVIFVFVWAVALMSSPWRDIIHFSSGAWTFLFLSGIAGGLSWLCYFRALQLGSAARVATVDKLSVVFVLAFAALFLGETMNWRSGLGGGLVVIGAGLMAMS